ncbi:MAG: FHA domain-containing protein [Candidatus Nitrospinota bacterium M3_3B_026]
MNEKKKQPDDKTDSIDLEALLREKEKLESLIKRKFSKEITVMFTDITGSTQIAEEIGDLAMRSLLKRHYDIIFPIVEGANGTLVKTMGDGTLSYFLSPADAVRAAIGIQRGFQEHNSDKSKIPLLIRCGLNTGLGIVEKKDIYGDVVNVAQRFEALAGPGDILLSEETRSLVEGEEDIFVVFFQEARIRGKVGVQSIYKALWDEKEIESHKRLSPEERGKLATPNGVATADVPLEWGDSPPTTQTVRLRAEPDARLLVEQRGREPVFYDLAGKEMIIGRSPKADIHLPEAFVSRRHARIYEVGGGYHIEDLKSHVGVRHKGEKIVSRPMSDGDEYTIGSVKLVFQMKRDEAAGEEDSWSDGSATMAFEAGRILSLVVEKEGRIIAHHGVSEKPMTIGRAEGRQIRLESPMVSRKHARIYKSGEGARVEDLGSNNGTYVNGKRVEEADVSLGDEIRIGPFALRVVNPAQPLDKGDANASMVARLFSFLSKK